MLQSLYTAANAIDTYKSSLLTTANNVANINTPYYKSNSLQLASLKQGGISVSSIRQNQSQAYTITSGRTLDFVIAGPGQFRLNQDGQDYFTRKGIFYVDGQWSLVDSDGRVLLDNVVQPGETASQVQVDDRGNVMVGDKVRGKIDIYDAYGNKMTEDQYQLKSGEVEASDVDTAKEVVNMLVAQKATLANYTVVRTNDEMLGLIVNLVG